MVNYSWISDTRCYKRAENRWLPMEFGGGYIGAVIASAWGVRFACDCAVCVEMNPASARCPLSGGCRYGPWPDGAPARNNTDKPRASLGFSRNRRA